MMERLNSLPRLGLLAFALLTAAPAAAQDAGSYPSRPVKLVVPFAPGGFPDAVARIVAERLQESLGKPFVVENTPGAGGIAASDAVAKADPDGHTLLVADNQQWGITPAIYKRLPYDPKKDLLPVNLLSTTPIFLAVNAKLPVKTVADLVALVKANPEKYDYGTPGVASAHHLTMEMLKAATGMKIEHIPYKGGSQVVPALANAEISIAFSALSNLGPFVKQDAVRLLAISTPQRSPNQPEVPTLAEAGVAGVDFTGALGIMAPARTPQAIIAKLDAALRAAIQHPASIERLARSGFNAVGSGPDVFAALVASDIEKFDKAARLAGIERQ